MTQPWDAGGVDLGVKTLAVLSTGESIPGPKAHRRLLAVLRRRSRALAQGLGQPREGEGASRPASRPHRHYPPGRDAQGDDAPRQGLAAHRRRGPQCARHGGQPPPGRSVMDGGFHEFRRQLDYKAKDLWRDGDRRGPLVSLEQDLFPLRFGPGRTGPLAAPLPLRLLRPGDRQGSQRRTQS